MTDSDFWKQLNLCIVCHKRKPERSTVCNFCQDRRRARKAQKILEHPELAPKRPRPSKWTCYQCGKPTKISGSLCDVCYEKAIPDSFKRRIALYKEEIIS